MCQTVTQRLMKHRVKTAKVVSEGYLQWRNYQSVNESRNDIVHRQYWRDWARSRQWTNEVLSHYSSVDNCV